MAAIAEAPSFRFPFLYRLLQGPSKTSTDCPLTSQGLPNRPGTHVLMARYVRAAVYRQSQTHLVVAGWDGAPCKARRGAGNLLVMSRAPRTVGAEHLMGSGGLTCPI